MSKKVIEVKNVTKIFKTYEDKGNSLKDIVTNWRRAKYEKTEVIKGISFDVYQGEVIGIIGRNGCGKSTTLKMLSKLLKPTSGEIKIIGRVSSLIELGAGFHPDMTGRENVYINASLYGFTKAQIDQKIDEIIQFSELEEYIDSPVRVYSSGMYMRLAFAVAISVEPEVLLVDEILGVGDAAFQRKCFNRVKAMTNSGMTIVIVSHSTGQVEQLCDRVIWIEDGVIREEGYPRLVCEHYLETMEMYRVERIQRETQQLVSKYGDIVIAKQMNRTLTCSDIAEQHDVDAYRSGTGEIEVDKISLKGLDGTLKQEFGKNEPFVVEIDYHGDEENRLFSLTVALARDDGVPVYEVSTESDLGQKLKCAGKGEIAFFFEQNHLLTGKYFLNIYIVGENGVEYDIIRNIIAIRVKCVKCGESGIVSMKHQWKINGKKFEVK